MLLWQKPTKHCKAIILQLKKKLHRDSGSWINGFVALKKKKIRKLFESKQIAKVWRLVAGSPALQLEDCNFQPHLWLPELREGLEVEPSLMVNDLIDHDCVMKAPLILKMTEFRDLWVGEHVEIWGERWAQGEEAPYPSPHLALNVSFTWMFLSYNLWQNLVI